MKPNLERQRRAIAEDVIAQIKAQKFIATTGSYVEHPDQYEWQGDLQGILKKSVTKKKPCQVCALGSAFLSTVRLYDQVTLKKDGDVTTGMRRKLREFFGFYELEVIEASFEQRAHFLGIKHNMYGDSSTWPARVRKARTAWNEAILYRDFLSQLDSDERLVWIMRAIANLAGAKITLKAMQDQMFLSLATDPTYAEFRNQLRRVA